MLINFDFLNIANDRDNRTFIRQCKNFTSKLLRPIGLHVRINSLRATDIYAKTVTKSALVTTENQ